MMALIAIAAILLAFSATLALACYLDGDDEGDGRHRCTRYGRWK